MPRSGDERWAYLNDVIVTGRALRPRLKPGIAIAVLRDGPSAPSARHREGIVHGAVEPSNITLERTGNANLIDIGAAFAREDAPSRSPRVRSVAGSPHSPPARDGNPRGRR
jgi:eukaryotic-like serine/threonine-protein kinase